MVSSRSSIVVNDYESGSIVLFGHVNRQTSKGKGLQAEYYNGINFQKKVFSRVDQNVNFNWNGQNSPVPDLSPKCFSVRWRGKLYVPVTGLYKFTASVNDGIRIWGRRQKDCRGMGTSWQ